MANTLLNRLPRALVTIGGNLTADIDGSEVYLVGGAVRDLLLGRETKDYDLVVRGLALNKLEHWLQDHGQVSLVGKNFGVFKWQPAGWAGDVIDVALPRTEQVDLGTGQYRDFEIQSDPNLPLAEDLKRRDFTINALALNLKSGEVFDPMLGQADLNAKLLRAVGKAEERFTEDLSRPLRCVRQACQLGFTIDTATWSAAKKLSQRVSSGKLRGDWLVPREIVARELLKALLAQPVRAVELFDEGGFLAELLPEVTDLKNVPQPPEFHSEGDVFEHTKLSLSALNSPAWQDFFDQAKPALNLVVAILLHDIGKLPTLKTPELHGTARIRTDGHDVASAAMIPDICRRLALTSYVDPMAGQVVVEDVAWLVGHHMLLVHGQPQDLKPSTIYRYFWHNPARGLALQQLIFADMEATHPRDGRNLTVKLRELQVRIKEIGAKLEQGQLKLLLSGDEIMELFQLKPGPQIGRLLNLLEAAQLEGAVKTKRQAEIYLHKQL